MAEKKTKPVPPVGPDPQKGYWGGHAPTPDGEPVTEPAGADDGEDQEPAKP